MDAKKIIFLFFLYVLIYVLVWAGIVALIGFGIYELIIHIIQFRALLHPGG